MKVCCHWAFHLHILPKLSIHFWRSSEVYSNRYSYGFYKKHIGVDGYPNEYHFRWFSYVFIIIWRKEGQKES